MKKNKSHFLDKVCLQRAFAFVFQAFPLCLFILYTSLAFCAHGPWAIAKGREEKESSWKFGRQKEEGNGATCPHLLKILRLGTMFQTTPHSKNWKRFFFP